MRLVCPNCDAQYEVDTAAIPDAGRDVQCSNCGHAWFQMHPDAEADLRLQEELYDDDAADLAPPPTADLAPPPPKRAPMDDTALAVLREEAAREAAVRQTERRRGRDALETQPDLGLAPPAVGAVAAERAAALMRRSVADAVAPPPVAAPPEPPPPPEPQPVPDITESRPAARRELLPDIEEINSTLRASTDRREDEVPTDLPEPEAPRRRGFRTGFLLMLILGAGLAMTYVMAPRIAAQIPGARPAITAYVGVVDRARLGLNAALNRATEAVVGFTGSGGG